jgi:hypothetical protein
METSDSEEEETQLDHEGQEAIWTEKLTFVTSSKQMRTVKVTHHPACVQKSIVLPGPSEFLIAT